MPPSSSAKTILLLLQYADRQPCIIQQGYHVCYINQAALEMFGYNEEEVIGQDARILAAPHEHARLTKYNHTRRHPEPGIEPPPMIYSLDIRRKSGEFLNTMIGVILVDDGSEPKYILMFFSGSNLLSREFADITDGMARLISHNTAIVKDNTATVRENTTELVSVQAKLDTITEDVREGILCMKDALSEVTAKLAVLEDWRKQKEDARKRLLTILGLILTVVGLAAGWYLKQ